MHQAVEHVHLERVFGVTVSEVTAGVKRARGRTQNSKEKNFKRLLENVRGQLVS